MQTSRIFYLGLIAVFTVAACATTTKPTLDDARPNILLIVADDLEADPGETHNLAGSEPEKYQELLKLWRTERRNLGIGRPQEV
jgi:hypothetical protein